MLDTIYFGNNLLQYLISFAIMAAGVLLGKILYLFSRNVIRHHAAKTETMLDDIIVEVLERPLIFLLVVIGFKLGYERLLLPEGVDAFLGNCTKIMLLLCASWFAMKFIDSMIAHYAAPLAKKTKSDMDDQLIPLVRQIVKWVIGTITVIMIIDNFGYDVGSLLAGLGLGGLAFALAAQDMLGNLFGGFSIFADSPFRVGDRIKVDNMDGIVREVGLRTTRMETFDGSFLTIPNSMLSKTVVENVTREKARRVKFSIGVTYDTSTKKMEKGMELIKGIVSKHPNTKENVLVNFTSFGDFSLNLLVIYWITNKDEILTTKNDINLAIKDAFEKAKIDMAFPTQTIEYKKVK